MEKLSVQWLADQLVAHIKKGHKVNAYDVLYYSKKAEEMQREDLNDAIWFGIDLEAGVRKKDPRFEEIVDEFIATKTDLDNLFDEK